MITLPEGWYHEINGDDHAIIFAPGKQGMVSVDYKQRGYRSGANFRGSTTSAVSYTGKAWKDRLETDAVEWLKAVLK